jgi:glycosyltransferase involved in cell wall biosynthesis
MVESKKPSLAVLVTYCEERELLHECVQSVSTQEERPEEILVYDDASQAPAEQYLEGLPAQVIRGETRRGPSFGRNSLLAASTADYVHFHDADDLFRHDWCRRVREAMNEGVDAVFTEICSYRDGVLVAEKVLGLERLARGCDFVRFCLEGSMLVPSGTYRRAAVMQLGGYRTNLWQSEDFDFHARLAAIRPRYRVVDEPLVIIRLRESSRSRNQVEVWSSALDSVELLSRELPPEYRGDLAEAAARAGSMLFREGARSASRRAFELARRLGPPRFHRERAMYRVLARTLGPEAAERLGSIYRRWLPEGARQFLAADRTR